MTVNVWRKSLGGEISYKDVEDWFIKHNCLFLEGEEGLGIIPLAEIASIYVPNEEES